MSDVYWARQWVDRCLVLLVVVMMVQAAEAYESSTMRRERLGVIPTVYGDLRRPMLQIPMVMPRPGGSGLVQLRGWSDQVVRRTRGAEDEGTDRYELELTYAQSLWRQGMIGSELRIGLAFAQENDRSAEVTTLESLAVVPVWRSRYAVVTVVGGPVFGFTHGDLQRSHSRSRPGYRGQVRAGTSLGRLGLLTGFIGGEYWDKAVSAHDDERRDYRGKTIPAGDWDHQVLEFHSGLGYSRRLTTWARAGVTATAAFREWRGRGNDFKLQGWHGSSALFVELTPVYGVHVCVGGGLDPFDVERGINEAWQAHAAITVSW